MNHQRISTRVSLLTAGIALALGSALTAQQSQPGAQSPPSAQSQQQQSQQQSSQQQNRSEGEQSAQRSGQEGGSLDQLTAEHDNLSTFVRALETAGLAEELTGGTQYTVFAPTDEAFSSLGRSVEELLAPENREQLVSILQAHIVADDVDPEMARRINEALTLDGSTVTLEEQDGTLMVGDASVVEEDIQQGNLRIYAIDGVLDRGETQVATSEQERPQG
jgi:uncharacterized surface protein with fasciclin (FAS1) repeats